MKTVDKTSTHTVKRNTDGVAPAPAAAPRGPAPTTARRGGGSGNDAGTTILLFFFLPSLYPANMRSTSPFGMPPHPLRLPRTPENTTLTSGP